MVEASMSEIHLSPIEIGLLTIAERRGAVRTPRKIDERNDPTNVERLCVLRRLVELGFMVEAKPADETVVELEFTMSEGGKTALAALDQRGPVQH
jgi:hypothetical protein